MPRRQFVPLELDKIEDGQFLGAAQRLLQEMNQKMIAYVRKHQTRAKGAKATLTLQITICCENPDPMDEAYSLKATPKLTLPAAPAFATTKIHATEGQTGEPELHISYCDEPVQEQQGILFKNEHKSREEAKL